MKRLGLAFLILTAWCGCSGSVPAGWMGAYRLADGRVVSIRESTKDTYRYRFEDGRSGRLCRSKEGVYVSGDGFAVRKPETLTVTFAAEPAGLVWAESGSEPQTGRKLGRSLPAVFDADGITLRGRVDLPEGPGPHPAVVLVHGSGETAVTRTLADGDFLLARGVAVLVYDKRGTGDSQGSMTFDFHRLAADVSGAVEFLRTVDEIDAGRIGLCGYSQGGWVAPLAAGLNPAVRFVVVSYGMVDSPAEEARLEMRARMRERGVDDAGIEEADGLIRAAVDIVASDFSDGWDTFHTEKARYRDREWMKTLHGTPVGELLSKPEWLVKLLGPRWAPKGMSWRYDSRALLDTLDVPSLWLLAEKDRSAPSAETRAALDTLRAGGRPCRTILFPGADHTMLVFREENGARVYTGYHPDYYRTEAEMVARLAGLAPPAP